MLVLGSKQHEIRSLCLCVVSCFVIWYIINISPSKCLQSNLSSPLGRFLAGPYSRTRGCVACLALVLVSIVYGHELMQLTP
jgi:hypothetical protein